MTVAYLESLQINDSLHKDILECDREYHVIRKSINRQPGYVVDWELVDKAWEKAVSLHCRDVQSPTLRRKSGELYITHPRSVMEELAKLRCKSSVLAAALLHDTMEECSMTYESLREDFSYEVAEIVSAVTAIKAEEKENDHCFAFLSRQEQQDFLERLTNPKRMNHSFQREAFLVRFADRAHNLQTIASCDDQMRQQKIASTREFLIPVARKLGMRYFEIILNDLCMKYEGKDYLTNESALILEKRNALTRLSSGAYSQFDQFLHETLADQNVFSFPKFNPYAKLRGIPAEKSEKTPASPKSNPPAKLRGVPVEKNEKMLATPRRVLLAYELKQQLNREIYFERSRLDLWEVILTCKDGDAHNMLEKFLAMFRKRMKNEEMFFEYMGQEGDSLIIRLSDQAENNYRIVLLPESKLEAYFIGGHGRERLTMIEEQAPGDALRSQITVYSFSPKKGYRKYEKCVPYGATALDFAFIINPALGVTVKGARIHKWNGESSRPFLETDYCYPAGTLLSEGDVVHFDADYEHDGEKLVYSKANVTLDSLLDVNTQYGKKCLIKHFKTEYGIQEKEDESYNY